MGNTREQARFSAWRLGRWVLFFCGTLALAVGIPFASAEESAIGISPSDYFAALKIADRAVQKKKGRHGLSSAVSSRLLRSLFGRYYEVGDAWDVAVLRLRPNLERMTEESSHLSEGEGKPAIFHYRVTDVKFGQEPEVLIEVTQKTAVDPRVERLVLKMSDQFVQSEKSYFFAGSTEPLRVAPSGIRSRATPLELLPLDAPEVETAELARAERLPEIPSGLRALTWGAGRGPDLGQSFQFEQEDFFGRPVTGLWQLGDPWPAYLKTVHGVAVLVSVGRAERGSP